MRSKRAAIIVGGFLLSPLLLLLLAQIILAQEPPQFPHQFAGQVTSGGQPVGVLEVRVKTREGNKLVTLELTPESVDTTDSTGFYGSAAPFRVPPDTLLSGDELFFFLVTPDGTGDATTKGSQVLDPLQTVDLVLEPRSDQFIRRIPFLVDIVVKPGNGLPVDAVDVFLDFSNGNLEIGDITAGATLENVLSSSFDNTTSTIEYRATTSQTPPIAEFVLATVTFIPTTPAATTDVDFHQLSPRATTAKFQGASVLRSLAGLELARLVRAVTEIETELTKEVKPVLFEVGGTTILNLAIFGPPRNIDIAPASPSNDPRPTFTWTPPATGDFTGDVVGFEVRIVPDQTAFKDVGNVTSFTPGISDFPDPGIPDGPHTSQVRAVGTEDRKDAVGSLDFVITLITPPILVAPADNALLTTRTPFFDWEASTGEVDVYLLQVTSGDINGESLDIDVAIPGITTQFAVPTVDALAPAEYRWRVIARDVSLNTASSVTRTFTILPAGVGLRLESESVFVRVGTPFDVAIKVEPNLLPVSTITAFLDFNTADLEVLNIREGVTLEVVLVSSFDNSQGTVDFGATTLGQPVIGDFVLAVVTFVSNNEEVTSDEVGWASMKRTPGSLKRPSRESWC